ncbi:protein translocase subunit SecF [Coxiella endosymbiont of Amblyomma nuttalli]|uniref:protein translocase subunit SecF n=1 Tax=Coxiella endosymbiont of Amblyomma nuttalli TaxID=2749996 RepID=UPI001BA4C3FD|nr:protein translocase subunit SecF [Coxiella endosymbiont of Amblyomma nuttalli]QTS83953.1 Protein-export membrane protein SecF [Coxiella endosymbiont of Amblyomma nuttalli]
MEFFKKNTKIPFMRQRKWASVFSIIIFLTSIILLAVHNLNLGLDFIGGTQVEMNFANPVYTENIRKNLVKHGFSQAVVRNYDVHHISVRVASYKGLTAEQLKERLIAAMPSGQIEFFGCIGPQVGKQLMTHGILAIIIALLAITFYIALRFELRFAVSSVIALIHDPILILGIFSLFHIEFNLVVLAAMLTAIGYSLNDTIIIYDRIRENFRKIRHGTTTEVIDLSINQTLSRTIITSGLTLLAVIALFIFGGETLRSFGLALIIGIIIGTYSSIYIASSLAVAFGLDRQHLLPLTKNIGDDLS